ncbi:MAG: hypothetical protein PHR35_07075 [Kiritimatiellae bacterium]|nr:hypothetical protein [Kiritimatiellia bacterium]
MQKATPPSAINKAPGRIHAFFRDTAMYWLVAGLGSLYVFLPVLSQWWTISSPDDAPFFMNDFLATRIEALLTGSDVLMFQRLFNMFAPIFCHDTVYMMCQLLMGLSGYYYLRTQRLSRVAACGGGAMLAFSGYMFTLFSAGHLGFFYLISCVFWSFGLLARCIERRHPAYFAMLGGAIMWGQPGQPDVWVLVMGVLAAYAVHRLVLLLRSGVNARGVLLGLVPRFLLTAVVAGLLGAPGFRQVFSQYLAGRDKQIQETSRSHREGDLQADAQVKAQERWLFATGWSLPPEDCVEFLVPGIFGNDSFREPYPYWGRLGRPHDFQEGKAMPNYRQHTVYLGLVTVLLALIGIAAWAAMRKPRSNALPSPASASTRGPMADVPFWCAVWIVCLLLAMGSYTPVYRVFYALPYMDYLRAPVKWLHLAELATAMLAGFGLQALLSRDMPRRGRQFYVGAAAFLACALVMAGVAIASNGSGIEQHISALGLAPVASRLRSYATYNCLRAAGIAVTATALIWWACRSKASDRQRVATVFCVILLGVGDMTLVARRYVIPINVRPFHEENLLVREIRSRTAGRPSIVANYLSRNARGRDWLNTSLTVNGYPNMVPDNGTDPNSVEYRLAMATRNDPTRYWQAMGVRYLLLPRAQSEQLVNHGMLAPLLDFEMGGGGVWRPRGAPGQFLLGELRDEGLPRLYFDWRGGIARERQIDELVAAPDGGPVSDAPSPPAPSARRSCATAFTRMRGERGVLATRGDVTAPEPCLLVWNERYAPDLDVRLDGVAVPLRQVNGIWCGVEIPAGQHRLVCRRRYDFAWNAVLLVVSLTVAAWFLSVALKRRS